MCQGEGSQPSLSKPANLASVPESPRSEAMNTIAPRKKAKAKMKVRSKQKQQYGDRGSWLRFLSNSFHGVLGATSFLVTIVAWVSNDYCSESLALVLILLSVLTTTVLSIHSSWHMLEQSPHQSTILDCKLECMWDLGLRRSSSTKSQSKNNINGTPASGNFFRLRLTPINKNDATVAATATPASGYSFRIRVVAPHRGAFHRTSIIMQYANARILLLLQRKHWAITRSELEPSLSASASGIFLWGLITLMCLRMLLGEKMPMPSLGMLTRFKGAPRKTLSSVAASAKHNKPETAATTTTSTLKPLPPFWRNGNSYCFVLPMIAGVVGDFIMSAWCEHRYFSALVVGGGDDGEDSSLFGYYEDHWLSLWHLLFLQVAAHSIAFAFTLAFRIKHLSSKKDEKTVNSIHTSLQKLLNIKTLYWVCTSAVYTLIAIGLVKMRNTIRVV